MADTRTMRTRKPASAAGPACHRCTGLLSAEAARCAICGWPAGVGYPPADGEMEAAATPAEPEPAEPEEDHTAGQLDALSGMAERRTQPLATTAVAEASVEQVESEPESEPARQTDVDEPSDEVASADDVQVEEETDLSDEVEPVESAEIDPLTAPIEALTEDASIVREPKDEPTPIADEVAAAVPAAETAPVETSHAVAELDDESPTDDGPLTSRAPKLARAAQLLIVAAAMFNVLVAAINAVAGSPVDAAFTPVVLGVSLLTLAIWTGSAVVFLHWISRAYAFVSSTSVVRQRHGANMALVGWFIPILGLLIGYRVLQDLWAGSDPATRDEADAGTPKARSVDVWLLGIATSMIFGYAMPLALGDSSLWNGLAALGVLVAGVALASTIGTISVWQAGSVPTSAPAEQVEGVEEGEQGTVSTRMDDMAADEPVSADEPVATEPTMVTAD